MKKFILCSLAVFAAGVSFTQAPGIEWQNTIGSVNGDNLYSIHQTSDEGYILAGSAGVGVSGDKTDIGVAGFDYWVVKLDSLGNLIWQNAIGGNDADILYDTKKTADGGYILGGISNSGISVDKTEANIGSPGTNDFWIVKIDSIGNVEWENTIGGNSQDFLTTILQTEDGGYFIGGYSNSGISGDKTEAAFTEGFAFDYWVVKLDSWGNILWQNVIGGNGDDKLYSVDETTDGGYILGGTSDSGISGDKTEPTVGITSAGDYWIIKIDSSGEIEWQNTIGGNDWDYLFSVQETLDNGYILGGYSFSGNSGDKTEESIGFEDYWVIKLNSDGSISWQNTIGGMSSDRLYSMKQTLEGGYILGGISNSNISTDKSENAIAGYDYWIVKLNSIGTIEWDKTLGGDDHDYLYNSEQTSLEPTGDFGYILGGTSQSPISGDKTENNVGPGSDADYWIIKLLPEGCTQLTFFADTDGDGYGNPMDSVYSCIAPLGYISDNTDCNDLIAAMHPGAAEICNGMDDDCNLNIDDGLPIFIYYLDADADEYGDIFSPISSCNDSPPANYVNDNTDCDDNEESIHEPILYFADMDGDFFGDSLNAALFCSIFPPASYVINDLDCDDSNPLINPFSNEILNGLDDNCNDTIDEGLVVIENLYKSEFEIYPNPNNGCFDITFQNYSSQNIIIVVFNAIGEKVFSAPFNLQSPVRINLPPSFCGIADVIIRVENFTESRIVLVF